MQALDVPPVLAAEPAAVKSFFDGVSLEASADRRSDEAVTRLQSSVVVADEGSMRRVV